MVKSIDQLLHCATALSEREKALRAEAFRRGERYNVFQVCKVDHYENMHSAILAEWLNPKGSHGQGDLFLRLFFESCSTSFPEDFQTGKAVVQTEFSTGQGRLDILIDDQSGKAVIVENKIYAGDQDAQLRRYASFAGQRYPEGYVLMYLTLNGTEPSEQSSKGVKYSTLSYQTTIRGWIDRCIREVFDKPFLRETFIQYRNLLNQLTGQDMDKYNREELVAAMLCDPEGTAAIIKAYPEWENTLIEKHLFEPLRLFSEERNLGFNVTDKFWSKSTWGRFEFIVQPELKIVFEYERQGRNYFYYGITDGRKDNRKKELLPGLQGGNDNWPYGWHYLDMHLHWSIDDIVAISRDNGEFLRYICNAVDRLLEQMKEYNIL